MKVHTTNYFNAFIEVAEDCPEETGVVLPVRGNKKSVANYQYEMLVNAPYQYTSDEILFMIHATRKDVTESEIEAARTEFFSKGQPCLRSSPLSKRYGWGFHFDPDGKVAMFARESEQYENYAGAQELEVVKAMRSKRKK